MPKNKIINYEIKNEVAKAIQGILIIFLIILIAFMMIDVHKIQGNARVINYAGIVRGATQRLIKLEIVGEENNQLQEYLDDIFSGLMHGGGKYDLTKIEDKDYQEKLNKLNEYWGTLKEEILKVRENGYEQTDIIAKSEEYFHMADETVAAAEIYAQKYATQVSNIEKVLTILIVLIVFLLIKQSVDAVILIRNNRELKKKAYTDLHTGLPNKSRCEELLMNRENLTVPTAMAVFDLNGLKFVNDTLGHIVGDTLIMNFANILRTSIPEQYFVGRYGGDEFIAIFPEINENQVEQILNSIQEAVDQYNKFSKQIYMEYAVGYAVSTSYQESNLKILLDKADKKMYERKSAMKSKR